MAWQHARELFEEALDLDPAMREGWVRAKCPDDGGLADAVLAMLQSDAEAELPVLGAGGAVRLHGPDLTGLTIGGFHVLRRIGEGGMGTVYEARQQRPQRNVALKTLGVRFPSERARRRFEDEADILARLRHPGIAQVIDAGSVRIDDQDVPWFAMELVDAPRPIDRFVREQALDARAAAALVQEVAEAVHHAHQRGVIHRDLKPANVLVDGHGHPKVIDFGIARLADDVDGFTRTGELLGTLAYMSPERLEGATGSADTAGDVYSLGVILYEVLVGQPPFVFEGSSPARLVDAVRGSEPPPPSSTARGVPLELDWITMRAMARERTRRYASAGELAQDLGRFRQRAPVHAGPPSASYRLRRLAWRHRLSLAGAAALFAAVAIGLVIAATGWHRVAAAEQLARRRADVLAEVNRFQERILRGTYGSEKGSDLRLVDVVEAAARELEHTRFDDAVVEAGVRNSIGISWLGVGRVVDAERELLRARELLAGVDGRRPAELAIAISGNLGICYGDAGNREFAEREARRALAERIAAYPPDGSEVALGQHNLAVELLERAAWSEALDLATAAHETFARCAGEASEHTIHSLVVMANALRGLGRSDHAKAALDEARVLAERHLHADHPARLALLTTVAATQFEAGDIEASVRTWQDIVAARERVAGPTHPQTLAALSSLASALGRLERFAEAEATLRRVVTARTANGVRDGFDYVVTGQSLNAVVRRQGRAGEAEPMCRELLEVAKRSLPPGHWLIGIVTKELGGCLVDLRRFDAAEPLLLEAHAVLVRTLQPNDYRVQRTVQELASLYRAWQRPDDEAAWSARIHPPR